MAPWRSGYAEVCKTFYTGSIPVGASKLLPKRTACGKILVLTTRASGGMVYTADLKSVPLTRLWVRVPPRPPTKKTLYGSFLLVVVSWTRTREGENCQWQFEDFVLGPERLLAAKRRQDKDESHLISSLLN